MSTEPYFDKDTNRGFKHLINATIFSLRGLKQAIIRESAFRQEFALLVISIPLAFLLANNAIEFAMLISVILFVMVVELLNSAIESTIDRIGTEFHELAGVAKDYGSAAVMISLIIAFLVWAGMLLDSA